MHIELFQNLGLSKNEAEIYEALLTLSEASITDINTKTGINRRNIYDVLNRLMEKGLVFPVLSKKENYYKPVDPRKLLEDLREKETTLQNALPSLEKLYRSSPKDNEIYIYKGPEGWKNYMRDIIRVGEPLYVIAAKGLWLDERVKDYFPTFFKETKRKNIAFYHLFDWRIQHEFPEILKYITKDYKFLPKEYTTPGGIDVFGDYVNILYNTNIGHFDEDFSFTVIVNPQIAESFRTWFKFMYDFCPEPPKRKKTKKKNNVTTLPLIGGDARLQRYA